MDLQMTPRNELQVEVLRLEEKAEPCPSFSDFPQKRKEKLIEIFIKGRRTKRLVRELPDTIIPETFLDRLCDEEGEEIKDEKESIQWGSRFQTPKRMELYGFYIRRNLNMDGRSLHIDTFFINGNDINGYITLLNYDSYRYKEGKISFEFGEKIIPLDKMTKEQLKEEYNFRKNEGYGLIDICDELFNRLK